MWYCARSNLSQRSERDRDSFPGKTMSEWFERFGGSSLCREKNEPVPKECEQEIERRMGTGSLIRLIIIDPLERIDDRFDAAEFHVGRTGTPVFPQSAWWVGRTGTDTVDFQISYELNHTFRVDEVEYRAHKLKSVGIHEGEFNMLFKSDTIKE